MSKHLTEEGWRSVFGKATPEQVEPVDAIIAEEFGGGVGGLRPSPPAPLPAAHPDPRERGA
jgi:hypothetical protein